MVDCYPLNLEGSGMTRQKTQWEHEEELIIGIGSQGTAALGIVGNLIRALHSKGTFSAMEVAAIFDATVEQAGGSGDPTSERFAESVRGAVRECESYVLKRPASGPMEH
jgi:hypothetical protein